jgi:hypothetical protein
MWLPPIVNFAHIPPAIIPQTNFRGIPFWTIVISMVAFWLFAYIFAIQRASVDKRAGIPALAIAGDVAWEGTHSLVIAGYVPQRTLDFVWFAFDLVLLYQVFRYGNKDFPSLTGKTFRAMIWGVIAWCAVAMILLTRELNDTIGAYDGYFLVIFVSWSFIYTLRRRRSSAGQSMYIAVSKWVGTSMAGLNTFFVYPHHTFLIYSFITAFALDVTYMVMLYRQIRAEGASPWVFRRPPVTAPADVPAAPRPDAGADLRVSHTR